MKEGEERAEAEGETTKTADVARAWPWAYSMAPVVRAGSIVCRPQRSCTAGGGLRGCGGFAAVLAIAIRWLGAGTGFLALGSTKLAAKLETGPEWAAQMMDPLQCRT